MDRVRIELLRGSGKAYDQVHSVPAGGMGTPIRVRVDFRSETEALTLRVQVMDGTQVVFSGSRQVTLTSGQTAKADVLVSTILGGRILSINGQPVVQGDTLRLSDSIAVVARVTADARTSARFITLKRPEDGGPLDQGWLGFFTVPSGDLGQISAGETLEFPLRTATAPAGTYPLSLVVGDTAVLHTVNVRVTQSDVTPPTLSISEPADRSTVSTDTVTLRFTATDNRGVARYQVTANDRRGAVTVMSRSHATYTNSQKIALRQGQNVVSVTVFDIGLNATTKEVVFFR